VVATAASTERAFSWKLVFDGAFSMSGLDFDKGSGSGNFTLSGNFHVCAMHALAVCEARSLFAARKLRAPEKNTHSVYEGARLSIDVFDDGMTANSCR
jgi:hypothetical protein